jgi:CRISPR-associated endonuclease Csn1
MQNSDYATLSKYLYRVQKLAKGDYVFRHHLETKVDDDSKTAKSMGKFIRIKSLKSLTENNPHKVRVSLTGKITEI